MEPINPSGLCMCGCGEPAPISPKTDKSRGYVKGQPLKYRVGHHTRLSPVEYIESNAGYTSPCWLWQRSMSNGYGVIGTHSKVQGAHRVYYERFIGPIPEGTQLDHLCRNRSCVNPAHLEPVSNAENTRRGDRAKLDYEKASEIRALRTRGMTYRALAERFGVSQRVVTSILRGDAWR